MKVKFEELEGADLNIDCIYEAGNGADWSAEPLIKLFPSLGTAGGIRKVKRDDNPEKPAYIVLYTDMSKLEWPDYLDEETGIFRYYGDNRKPGRELTATHFKGNKLLQEVFHTLNSGESLEDMPPFFVFKNAGGRDKQFLGLAVPGNPNISPDKDLVAFWRTMDGKRFQNYVSYFTILDTGEEPISHEWLVSLIEDHENNLQYAPDAWKDYIKKGREGIKALKSPIINKIPTKKEQLECNGDEEGKKCVNIIYNHYKDNPVGFEACAKDIISKMDANFSNIELTPPRKDGGRDAVGKYQICVGGNSKTKLKIDFSMEAKCFGPDTVVNVHHMARLISRIRHRQFGIFITTSYFGKQVYDELYEDSHPILLINASDIAELLRLNSINSKNIHEWLDNIDENDSRF